MSQSCVTKIHPIHQVVYSNYGSCVIFQGEEGVREVLQILNDEFRLSMALSGKRCAIKLKKKKKNYHPCYMFCLYPNQAAGTWQKSTGTSFSSRNSNRPADGPGARWTGLATEPNQQWRTLHRVGESRGFIVSGNMKCASSVHHLEMTSVWYPVCIHARVYEWESVLGKAEGRQHS